MPTPSELTAEEVFGTLSLQMMKQASTAFDERQEEREEDRRIFAAALGENNAMLASLQQSLAAIARSLATPALAPQVVPPLVPVPPVTMSITPTPAVAPITPSSVMPNTNVPPLVPTSTVPPLVPTTIAPPLEPSTVLQPAPDQDTRICRSEKMTWPKCPTTDDIATIQGWRMKFLSAVNNCDLQDLYDPITHDLVRMHPNPSLVTRLCNSLTQALPDGHPLLLVTTYYRQGLLLWHAFSATVIPVITYHKRQELIQRLFHQTSRVPTEDVYTYHNRITVAAEYINKGTTPPVVSEQDLRRCFLFSLGPEFDYLRTDDIEGRMDQSYLVSDIEPLLQRLQGILHTKRSIVSTVPTISSSGYANAIVPHRPDVMDDRINTLADMVGDLHQQMAALLTPAGIAAAVVVPTSTIAPTPTSTSAPTPHVPIQFYCHTHGIRKHHSHECTNPGPNHNPKATFKHRMGGSNYKPA